MKKVFLSLGTNVGDRKTQIMQAVEVLKSQVFDIQMARLYKSKAVGFTNQPDFYNTAVLGNTSLNPQQLLKFIKASEEELGRVERFHWGPREIDIDIIFYGDLCLTTNKLIIPHPRAHERNFVLKPILDLEPEFIHPVFGKTVKKLYEALPKENLYTI